MGESPYDRPRTFWGDVFTHGFGSAVRKWTGKFQVSGKTYTFKGLLDMSPTQRQGLLADAVRAKQHLAACWAFEAELQSSRNFETSWVMVSTVLLKQQEADAVNALDVILRIVTDAELLGRVASKDPACCFLLGRLYLWHAKSAQHRDENELTKKRKLALFYLDIARKAPAYKSANATYEKAMYLKFIPPQKGKKGKSKSAYSPAVAGDGG